MGCCFLSFGVCACLCVAGLRWSSMVRNWMVRVISNWPGIPLGLIWDQNRTHLQAEYWACDILLAFSLCACIEKACTGTHSHTHTHKRECQCWENESNVCLWKKPLQNEPGMWFSNKLPSWIWGLCPSRVLLSLLKLFKHCTLTRALLSPFWVLFFLKRMLPWIYVYFINFAHSWVICQSMLCVLFFLLFLFLLHRSFWVHLELKVYQVSYKPQRLHG